MALAANPSIKNKVQLFHLHLDFRLMARPFLLEVELSNQLSFPSLEHEVGRTSLEFSESLLRLLRKVEQVESFVEHLSLVPESRSVVLLPQALLSFDLDPTSRIPLEEVSQ